MYPEPRFSGLPGPGRGWHSTIPSASLASEASWGQDGGPVRPGKSSPGSAPAPGSPPRWPALPTAGLAQELPRLPAWVSQGPVSCLCLLPTHEAPARPRCGRAFCLPAATHRSLMLPWRDWAPSPAHMWDVHLSGVGLGACQGSQPEEPAPQDHKEGARPAAFCLGLVPAPSLLPRGAGRAGARQRPAPCGPHTLTRQCALEPGTHPQSGGPPA